jgi:hypothetical protein
MVSRWEADGIPLKVVFGGVDRAVERQNRKGPRRRPLRIEFCEADVLDAFDAWRRAVGVSRADPDSAGDAPAGVESAETSPRRTSVPAHLERALLKLSNARATGRLGPDADPLTDHVARELDTIRASGRGVRGAARTSLAERLAGLDDELIGLARRALDEGTRAALEQDAREQLRPFRDRMPEAAYAKALSAAVDRLVRDRLDLPILTL